MTETMRLPSFDGHSPTEKISSMTEAVSLSTSASSTVDDAQLSLTEADRVSMEDELMESESEPAELSQALETTSPGLEDDQLMSDAESEKSSDDLIEIEAAASKLESSSITAERCLVGAAQPQENEPTTSTELLIDQDGFLSKLEQSKTDTDLPSTLPVELLSQLSIDESSGVCKPPTPTELPAEHQAPLEAEPFSEADLLAESEVSLMEDELLIETEPLDQIQALDELELFVDLPPADHALSYSKPTSDFKSMAMGPSHQNKSLDVHIEDQPELLLNNDSKLRKPLSKSLIRPPSSSSSIPLPRSNNSLSIRSNLPQKSSYTIPPPRSKVPGSNYQSNGSTASKSSIAKPTSSASSTTSSIRVSDKTIKSLKSSTSSTFKSTLSSGITKSRHPAAIALSKSTQNLRSTPSQPVTPSKPASSTTPSKPRSVIPSTPRSASRPPNSNNPTTPKSISRASSSIKKSQVVPNGETTLSSNVDAINGSSFESSHKTLAKSSQGFREMLAQAKRSRPKLPTVPNSPNPDSIPGQAQVPDQPETLDPWGFQPIEKTVEKAQRTGKLNVGSRMLSKVPAEIYAKLLSHTSIFHPSNRPSSAPNHAPQVSVDLKFSFDDDENKTTGVPWYETVDLVHLNMSLNELTELDDEFGGFEALTNCDLHCNQLTSLPYTFGLLTNLTILDLSSNQLSQFPVPILSLVNLIELNLSKNLLTQLWPLDWKPTLKKQLATAVKPPPIGDRSLGGDQSFNSMDQSFNSMDQPSTMTNSSFSHEEFCDQFPSSPKKSYPSKSDRPLVPEEGLQRSDRQPFPALRKLKLAGNKFKTANLFGPDRVQLPRNLQELDLTKNPLGKRIEVSSNLRNLRNLNKLNLSGCGLSDEIFWVDPEGEYDELENEEVGLFEHLTELDLTHNGIDSLEPLETFFDQHCAHHPRLDYVGLPHELVKLVNHHTQGTADVRVMIGHNFLRDEARRRRKMKIITAQSKPNNQTTEPVHIRAEIKANDDQDKEARTSPAEEIEETKPSSLVKPTLAPPNPTQTLLLKHHNQSTFSLNLNSLHLSELSENQEDYDNLTTKIDVKILNLSHNQFTKFPTGIISSFSSSLTMLNLSRNRMKSIDDDDHVYQLMMKIKLPELIEFNLSSNFLIGSLKPIINLLIKGFQCYKLKILDLSFNQFSSLEGLYDLLKLHEICDQNKESFLGLDKLVLEGNRISDINDLVRISTEIKDSNVEGGYKYIEEIRLSDNSIEQLPACLGYLPTKSLHVARNIFRFPARNLYDCAGGDVKILAWLRARN
ncbi:hypothetical protein MJO29_001110 [Puccinia striiformis f. sp. tritici]|nr:hypothetical protein MJO29_001110 [Puccinia striiformis f. sp. tritici]